MSDAFITYSMIGAKGVKMPRGDKKMMLNYAVYVPCLEEQKNIANCLFSIDSYISSINEKIEELKAHKKGLMQKLFPQNGKTIPEYRFPEFEKDGAWVEIKVSDIFEITRGHVLAASNTKSAPDDEYRYPVFSSQTAKKGLMGYYNKPLYTDAITWTTDGANAGTVNYREGPFYCTNVCGVLLSNKGYANKCIAELLSMEAKKHVSYVGNPKLMNNVMAEIKLYIPSIREQHRIASCLSSIDMLRQVNTEKRVQLEKIKKGLVQHLFPQI
jgi:type I restriction enzyme S subunit